MSYSEFDKKRALKEAQDIAEMAWDQCEKDEKILWNDFRIAILKLQHHALQKELGEINRKIAKN
ncbi:MAG TPA: hypothetical protein VF077_12890 [Nitrospiraceae bacterium]